ncbi:hypothetical protein [uncultured Dialister sp.]|uniref:hypothetical protein n=1 Tax=uncultured Dialister sp. TaxID=278064 RepID=UPI00265E79FB|nr:hypothetical protein [uncultured Dialister sp.]
MESPLEKLYHTVTYNHTEEMGRCTVCEIEIEAEIEEIIRSAAVLAGIHATGRASRETLIKWAFYKR